MTAHTVHFVTNRNAEPPANPKGFGKSFNPDSVDSFRMGTAKLEVADGQSSVVDLEIFPETIEKSTKKKSKVASDKVFKQLAKRMRNGTDVLVWMHGFNVSFEEALEVGGHLSNLYGAERDLIIIVFSWPSDGSMMPWLAYKNDRTDARASAQAFARGVMKLKNFLHKLVRKKDEHDQPLPDECRGKVHLLAHSMGNYVLRNGIQELIRQVGGQLPRIFDQLFLMAADEDNDSFEHAHKFQPLPEFGAEVNVYFNRGDTVLTGSDYTKGNPARLGSNGPRLPLTVPGNINLVDASEVVDGLLEHSYFWQSPIVVRDVNRVLNGERPERISGRHYVPAQNRYVLE